MDSNAKIFIIAGEPSGDRIGADLARALLEKNASLELMGLGGPAMKKAGVKISQDMTQMAVVGLFEVAKHYFEFRKIFHSICEQIKTQAPKIVILIDFPGFNLRLAKVLHRYKIKVIYYVSPQIWAWGKRRIKMMRRTIHRMIVILPFEEDFYRRQGVKVDFVGHPLVDRDSEDFDVGGIQEDTKGMNPLIAILPGSRVREIEHHEKILLNTARALKIKWPNMGFVIPCATPFAYEYMKGKTQGMDFIRLYQGKMRECLFLAQLAWVCSGTATLETGFWGTPMIIFYRVASWTAFLIRLLIKVPFVGLVNLVVGRKIVPELLQEDFNSKNLVQLTEQFFSNPSSLKKMSEDLTEVRKKLGMPGASLRAAEIVLEEIK